MIFHTIFDWISRDILVTNLFICILPVRRLFLQESAVANYVYVTHD